MAEFQTTLLQGEDADSDSDDEVYTDLAFDLAGDNNICRLAMAIVYKNCGADDKAHTLEARKHNPHGTYEVYDHSFAATINATDNTERLHIVVEDLFPEIAAPRTPHHCFSTNKLSQNQLQVERGLVLYDVNSASPLEHPSMAFKRLFLATTLYPSSISSIDSYIWVNNTRNLKEFAAESSHNEVNKMIHLGEALGLGNSAVLKNFFGLIIRQLEKEREDWQ
ncbi:hypothetical protein D5086_029933 [Populus alba]|uniref:Uncharacterized protein n=1 Tax=Populus alba TaxID=43335 RepID=A0ACC4AM29_POPAL